MCSAVYDLRGQVRTPRLPDPEERGAGRAAPIAGWVGGDDAEAKPRVVELRRHQPAHSDAAGADLEAFGRGEGREERAVLVDAYECLAAAAVVEDVEAQDGRLSSAGRRRLGGHEGGLDVGGGQNTCGCETLQRR